MTSVVVDVEVEEHREQESKGSFRHVDVMSSLKSNYAERWAEYSMPSKVRNSLLWILEPLESDETYFRKRMFGCDAAYVDGLLCLVVADRDEPWNGLLVCTAQERHAALIEEMPSLQPHQVLGKWLCVKQSDPAFEDVARRVTSLVLSRDSRIGVAPKPRRPARKLR